jgi:hypothetical protein
MLLRLVLLSALFSALTSCRFAVVPFDPQRCLAGALPVTSAPAPMAHAHNDYEHEHPLYDALAHGFRSVEADVYLRGGRIVVSHIGLGSRGTLRELYLDPLARIVEQHGGSVYGDGRPFYLWIDLKEDRADLQAALLAELMPRAMLTRFDDSGEHPGAVTVVLTGDSDAGRALVAGAAPRPFVRDDENFDPDERPADWRWRAYSLEYDRYLSWDGEGQPDEQEVARLRCIVASTHARGRMVRLFAAPETPAFWRLAVELGVDFISSDDLDGVERIVRTEVAARE